MKLRKRARSDQRSISAKRYLYWSRFCQHRASWPAGLLSTIGPANSFENEPDNARVVRGRIAVRGPQALTSDILDASPAADEPFSG
jgi:hypothetical protein